MGDLVLAGIVGLGVGIGLVIGAGVLRIIRKRIDHDDTPKK